MGMYVCRPCMEQYRLTELRAFPVVIGKCEICGPLRDDWAIKSLAWTSDITRLGRTAEKELVEIQLAKLAAADRAAATEGAET